MEIRLIDPINSSVKNVSLGVSFFSFLFGPLVPLFRGDFIWFILDIILNLISFFIFWFIFPFIYNRIYIKNLLKKGFIPADEDSAYVLFENSFIEDEKFKGYYENGFFESNITAQEYKNNSVTDKKNIDNNLNVALDKRLDDLHDEIEPELSSEDAKIEEDKSEDTNDTIEIKKNNAVEEHQEIKEDILVDKKIDSNLLKLSEIDLKSILSGYYDNKTIFFEENIEPRKMTEIKRNFSLVDYDNEKILFFVNYEDGFMTSSGHLLLITDNYFYYRITTQHYSLPEEGKISLDEIYSLSNSEFSNEEEKNVSGDFDIYINGKKLGFIPEFNISDEDKKTLKELFCEINNKLSENKI